MRKEVEKMKIKHKQIFLTLLILVTLLSLAIPSVFAASTYTNFYNNVYTTSDNTNPTDNEDMCRCYCNSILVDGPHFSENRNDFIYNCMTRCVYNNRFIGLELFNFRIHGKRIHLFPFFECWGNNCNNN